MAVRPNTLTGPYAGAIRPVARLLSKHQGPLEGEECKAALKEIHLGIWELQEYYRTLEQLSITDRTNLRAFKKKTRKFFSALTLRRGFLRWI